MTNTIQRIIKIQNRQQSLQWGYHIMPANEVMFAVGHREYPKEVQYFVLKESTIYLLTEKHKKYPYKECEDEKSILTNVIELLKLWFPAKSL